MSAPPPGICTNTFSIGVISVLPALSERQATDSQDTLNFAELTAVRAMVETYPLEQAAAAYARMLSGDAQFRVVLTM